MFYLGLADTWDSPRVLETPEHFSSVSPDRVDLLIFRVQPLIESS